MSGHEPVTLTKKQEERLVEALELVVEAESVPTLVPPRRSSFWRRPMVVPTLAFITVLGLFLPLRLVSDGGDAEPTDLASEGFSSADAVAMEVRVARYPFDVDVWSASMPNVNQAIAEMAEEDLTRELVEVVRAAASNVLADVDAEPPYMARIISAWDTAGTWNALITTDFAEGQCFVVIDRSSSQFHTCRQNDSGTPGPIMLKGDDTGLSVLPADPSFSPGSWVSVVWWGLPPEATYVSYRTAATEPETNSTPILDGTIRLSVAVQGVDQRLSIEARGPDDEVVMDASVLIPAFAGADDILQRPATEIVYETDPTDFVPVMDQGDTFLGGGYVNGEPWAIVGRSLAVEGKPTLECSGVRPIRDEDVCDVVDGLVSIALPVGDTGGVLVVRTTADVAVIRVVVADEITYEAPLVGADQGYPPIAVVPLESAGISGNLYAITDDGEVLWAQPFTVNEIVSPGG